MKKCEKGRKNIYIGVGIFFAVVCVLIGGLFFIFGEDALDVIGVEGIFDDGGYSSGGDVENGEGGDGFDDEGFSGGGGGGSGGGSGGSGGDSGIDSVCLYSEQIQYSLGDFTKNIECLVYGVEGCEKVKMTCGSQIFNLDYETGGIFGIRYSLFFGKQEIDFRVIEENIAARERTSMNAEIVVEGVFDVASLECVIDSESVPMECVEWS